MKENCKLHRVSRRQKIIYNFSHKEPIILKIKKPILILIIIKDFKIFFKIELHKNLKYYEISNKAIVF